MVLKLIQKLTSPSRPSESLRTTDKAQSPANKSFKNLGLIDPILDALTAEGYEYPTPIQLQAIPPILAARDLLGCAQTGTGKTAAFALPILQRLSKLPPQSPRSTQPSSRHRRPDPAKPRSLVLAPTRELALQICESFKSYGRNLPYKSVVVFGGVGVEPQVKQIQAGVDILVATPGRLLDLMERGVVGFSELEILVLDEADRMLDMGFIHDIKKIIRALNSRRQNLLLSATIPKEVRGLINEILVDPVTVEVAPASSTSEQVTQRVYHVGRADKKKLLLHVLETETVSRALIFTRTKHNANKLERFLNESGINAAAIHGNKSQSARQRALDGFRTGKIRILVASDIAARGIDIDDISHVINFEMANDAETYVHRIGRTGRADARGVALSFCDYEEQATVAAIERMARINIPVVTDHPFTAGANTPVPPRQQQRGRRQQNQSRQHRSARPNRRAKPAKR